MTSSSRSVNLRYFALMREQRGVTHETIVTAAVTLRDLYKELTQLYPFTLPVDRMSVAINDQFCNMDTALKDGDNIVFIPPVAGG